MLRLLFLLFSSITFAQVTLSGSITGEDGKSLPSATVIAKASNGASPIFAVADELGKYSINLGAEQSYEINVSYVGFVDQTKTVALKESRVLDFRLLPSGENLREIVIKHKYKPVIVKKDTLIYDVKSFAAGDERKLKEILEKLPGIEVDRNGIVTVQGKQVTQMMVEGKSFFGGGSRLAVENIPADALDKIEVLDHFSTVGFLKEVSQSDELAMNIKLKESKKKFAFGDIEAGYGSDDYYRFHTALFYYSAINNFSFIGDLNNIGESTFTFQDLMRFQGGSTFLTGRRQLSILSGFTTATKDVTQSRAQFAAANFNHTPSSEFSISGHALFSRNLKGYQTLSHNEYLLPDEIAKEDRLVGGLRKDWFGTANVKGDYTPSKTEKFFYNANFQIGFSTHNNSLNTISDSDSNVFLYSNQVNNLSLKQYFEWHKSHTDYHSTSIVVSQAFESVSPENIWTAPDPFLEGFLPLLEDDAYKVAQTKRIDQNVIDGLVKHNWILNPSNHVYFSIGNTLERSAFVSQEQQILSSSGTNDFSDAGFGNNSEVALNDLYIGADYKFKVGKLVAKPGLFLHYFYLKSDQIDDTRSLSKLLFQPVTTVDYGFSDSEKLSLNYRLSNVFPDAEYFANHYTLEQYNLVFKGNALLENERFHQGSLIYTKMNMLKGLTINGYLGFNKKVRTLRNRVVLSGIEQFSTPVLSSNPETLWRVSGSASKKFGKITAKLSSRLSWFDYVQELDGMSASFSRNSQEIGAELRTSHKKWPDLKLGYKKGFSRFLGNTEENYTWDSVYADASVNIFGGWTVAADYESMRNANGNNYRDFYSLVNASIRYQKKNSPFSFELIANNLFDNNSKEKYSFSDYVISRQSTIVLPRIILFSVNYKL